MTTVYQMGKDELLSNMNKALNIVVDSLRIEGYLTKEQAEEINTNYSLILESRSWLPVFLADWLGIKKDAISMRLVKAVGRKESHDAR